METLYYCQLCQRTNFIRRTPHKSKPGAANPICPGDFIPLSPEPCFTCQFRISRACPDPSLPLREPWRGCGAWLRQTDRTGFRPDPVPSVPSVPVRRPVQMPVAPSLDPWAAL